MSIFTVADLLDRPLFQEAKVVAGANGLKRKIRWVHILEISNFPLLRGLAKEENILQGEEVILTSGFGLDSADAFPIQYLDMIIQSGASCLCVDLRNHSIPEKMTMLANKHDFPLIIFHKNVRYIDVTQDIHALIINHQYKVLEKLEQLSNQFQRLSLTSAGVNHILKLLSSSIHTQAFYYRMDKQQLIDGSEVKNKYPKKVKEFIHQRVKEIGEKEPNGETYFYEWEEKRLVLKMIGTSAANLACVVLLSEDPVNQFQLLALDSAVLSISQVLLRERYQEERKFHSENLWLLDLIHNRFSSDEEIKANLKDWRKSEEIKAAVCVIEAANADAFDPIDDGLETNRYHLSMAVRRLFESQLLVPYITFSNQRLIVLLLDLSRTQSFKSRISSAAEQLWEMVEKIGLPSIRMGIGQSFENLVDAANGFNEAIKAINGCRIFNRSVFFFEDLGIYELIMHVDQKTFLQPFVEKHLGPLIEYDKNKNSQLLQTLRVYLECGGSKRLTAEKLFIVRQALYYRLEKIGKLIGDDYMRYEKRLAVQVALYAYHMADIKT